MNDTQQMNEQDRLEARHQDYGEQAIESIVDDLFRGKKVCHLTIHDFCDDITPEDIGAMMLNNSAAGIRNKVTANIKEWCAGSAVEQSLVAERERELDSGE